MGVEDEEVATPAEDEMVFPALGSREVNNEVNGAQRKDDVVLESEALRAANAASEPERRVESGVGRCCII